jgi:hypothetical protein
VAKIATSTSVDAWWSHSEHSDRGNCEQYAAPLPGLAGCGDVLASLLVGWASGERTLGVTRFQSDGRWVDVDLNLVRNADGSVAPKAHPTA